MDRFRVGRFIVVVASDEGVAATKCTERLTEWDVDVERPASRRIRSKSLVEFSQPLIGRRIVGPIRHGGITGIAWGRNVVFSQKLSRIHIIPIAPCSSTAQPDRHYFHCR